MKLDWLRRLTLPHQPAEQVRVFQELATALAGGQATWFEYEWWACILRGEAGPVAIDDQTVAGECALRQETLLARGAVAVPAMYFGSLLGVLVIEGPAEPVPLDDLHELAETFSLVLVPHREIDRSRQALSRFEQLAVASVEGRADTPTGHVAAVCQLSAELAEYLDLSPHARQRLWNAALYHDIGKVLEQGEATHTRTGAEFLRMSGVYAELAPLVEHHHERIDGSGPHGKRAGELSLEQWVLALAEDFEEYRSERGYLGFKACLAEFFQHRAPQHHPDAIDALAGLIDSGRLERLQLA